MIGPIAFGNTEAAQATQQVAAPEQAAVQEQPVSEKPLPQAPAQDTFTPAQAEAAPQADPNDQFVKNEQPAEQKEKED